MLLCGPLRGILGILAIVPVEFRSLGRGTRSQYMGGGS